MAVHITLPNAPSGSTVIGGVEFIDGEATAELGPNVREFFTARGAHITEVIPVGIADLTRRELIAIAETGGLNIPAKATKAEIVENILAAGADSPSEK